LAAHMPLAPDRDSFTPTCTGGSRAARPHTPPAQIRCSGGFTDLPQRFLHSRVHALGCIGTFVVCAGTQQALLLPGYAFVCAPTPIRMPCLWAAGKSARALSANSLLSAFAQRPCGLRNLPLCNQSAY
jgi:hypothetical protein